MGRKRVQIDTSELRDLMRRGATTEEVARHFGCAVSTAHERMKAMRAGVRPVPSTPARGTPSAAPPAPKAAVAEVPDDVPEGASLELVDKWIAKLEAAGEVAEGEGDLKTFATIAAKLVTLLEHRRKAAPPTVEDPNEAPDMVALAEDVRKRLHKLIEQVSK